MDVTLDIVSQMVQAKYGEGNQLSSEQREEERRQMHNLLFAAFKKERTKDTLPSLHYLLPVCM
jgi:hypothetical protein